MAPQQLSYTQDLTPGRAGQRADMTTFDTNTFVVSADETSGIAPGLLVVRDPDGAGDRPTGQTPIAQAADVDAIIVTGVSAGSPDTYDGADLDGAVGGNAIAVPAPVTLTLSSSADWDATSATLTAVDSEGNLVTETLAIPDGGNATVTSTGSYTRVESLLVPTQSGAGGTFTLGFAVSNAVTAAQILGVVLIDEGKEDPLALAAQTVAAVVRRGRVYVETEHQVSAGERAFVRLTAAGNEQAGAWRGDSDSGDAVPVSGARFYSVHSATLAVLEIDFAT